MMVLVVVVWRLAEVNVHLPTRQKLSIVHHSYTRAKIITVQNAVFRMHYAANRTFSPWKGKLLSSYIMYILELLMLDLGMSKIRTLCGGKK